MRRIFTLDTSVTNASDIESRSDDPYYSCMAAINEHEPHSGEAIHHDYVTYQRQAYIRMHHIYKFTAQKNNMKFIPTIFVLTFLITIFSCNSTPPQKTQEEIQAQPWDSIVATARGQSITMVMWQGDPNINNYMKSYVAPALQKKYGITLRLASGQGNEIVRVLSSEIQAGKQQSDIDMMWINGETFYQLRQIKALYGPFTGQLPNNQYLDWDNPMIATDFQQAVEGMECPWGNVQMAIIYDSKKTETPPQNMEELEAYVKAHPGTFTVPVEFTGYTLLKSWLMALAKADGTDLQGSFDEQKYKKYSQQLWEYLNRIKPYFWNKGTSFPNELSQMHQLFANGELHFTMSNNDAEVDNKILQGAFPESARAYVPETGTIQNSHYLGIVRRSGKVEAAMVVCNFLISPEAQLRKLNPQVWGDGTVLNTAALPGDWPKRFKSLPERRYAPPRAEIQSKALMEPAAEYMIRIERDFREKVVLK